MPWCFLSVESMHHNCNTQSGVYLALCKNCWNLSYLPGRRLDLIRVHATHVTNCRLRGSTSDPGSTRDPVLSLYKHGNTIIGHSGFVHYSFLDSFLDYLDVDSFIDCLILELEVQPLGIRSLALRE
jgi:hypothetical protein